MQRIANPSRAVRLRSAPPFISPSPHFLYSLARLAHNRIRDRILTIALAASLFFSGLFAIGFSYRTRGLAVNDYAGKGLVYLDQLQGTGASDVIALILTGAIALLGAVILCLVRSIGGTLAIAIPVLIMQILAFQWIESAPIGTVLFDTIVHARNRLLALWLLFFSLYVCLTLYGALTLGLGKTHANGR